MCVCVLYEELHSMVHYKSNNQVYLSCVVIKYQLYVHCVSILLQLV